jgi:fluoroquinolone transport system permease protein
VGLLLLLPDVVRANPAALAPAFLLANLQVTAFYFAAALVLLEKGQGSLTALSVTPLRPREYLAARALALGALGVAEGAAIVALAFGPRLGWPWLVAGTLAAGVVYALLGFVAVAPYDGINRFLMPSVAWLAGLTLPLLGYYDLVPWAALAWHPLMPPLLLLAVAWDAATNAQLVYGVLGTPVAVAGAGLLARRAWARNAAA